MLFNNLSSTVLSFMLLLGASKVEAAGPSARNALSVTRGVFPKGSKFGNIKFRGSIGNVEGIEIEGRDVKDIINKVRLEHPELELHLENPPSALYCCPVSGQHFDFAYREYIDIDTAYLYSLNGRCGVDPRQCVRIACEQNQAIFLCNDNNYFIEPSCAYLASYAQDIEQDCNLQRFIDGRWQWLTCGQELDSDNYNVVVAFQSCARDLHTIPGQ